ncbi:MAG: NUDIX domain-containing protein [Chloroflexi bacterium]|nr:NUDIX domain-containing protein [Chloroflexota bacterium]
MRRSAVLLIMYIEGDEPYLLFTRRTDDMPLHSGQISFPGGSHRDHDGTLLQTALREAAEEVGIAPEHLMIGPRLDDEPTHSSGYVITPFVAIHEGRPQPRPDVREVAEVFAVPLAALAHPRTLRVEERVEPTVRRFVLHYDYGAYDIWGATARIIQRFLARYGKKWEQLFPHHWLHPEEPPRTEVVTCFLLRRGPRPQVLLVRRSGRVGTYQGRWAGVSGYAEGQPAQQCYRELEEEVGLGRGQVRLLCRGMPLPVDDAAAGRRWLVHPFLFAVARDTAPRLDWEHTEARWVDLADIAAYETVPGLAAALAAVAKPALGIAPGRRRRAGAGPCAAEESVP